MKLTIPPNISPLSEEAQAVLRHLVATTPQIGAGFEYPATLEGLVPDARAREAALAELERHDFVERAIYPESVPPAIMSCRLTYEGKRFAEKGGLDD